MGGTDVLDLAGSVEDIRGGTGLALNPGECHFSIGPYSGAEIRDIRDGVEILGETTS